MRQLHLLALFVSLATFCTDSTAFAQRVVPRQFNDVQMFNDQRNKNNAERKRAIIAEATTRANQSKATIGQCEQRLAKLEGELKDADANQQKSEERFDNCEAELRVSRKRRADEEARLLAEQDDMSPYRLAIKSLSDAEAECTKQAERVLQRAIKDGSPDKLLNKLQKSEKASMEADAAWVDAHRQFSKAKVGVTEETKRLVLTDAKISEIDASIDQLEADQVKWKNERSKALKKHTLLKKQASSISSTLGAAQRDLASAQRDIAMAGGK